MKTGSHWNMAVRDTEAETACYLWWSNSTLRYRTYTQRNVIVRAPKGLAHSKCWKHIWWNTKEKQKINHCYTPQYGWISQSSCWVKAARNERGHAVGFLCRKLANGQNYTRVTEIRRTVGGQWRGSGPGALRMLKAPWSRAGWWLHGGFIL